MGGGHLVQPRLLDLPGVRGAFQVVDIVDVAGGVELGHEEGVPVPELGLHQRAVELLEAQGGQLVLERLQERAVGILAAHLDALGWNIDVVPAEPRGLPRSGPQHLRGEAADFFPGSPGGLEPGPCLGAGRGDGEDHLFPLRAAEEASGCAALLGLGGRQLLLRLAQALLGEGARSGRAPGARAAPEAGRSPPPGRRAPAWRASTRPWPATFSLESPPNAEPTSLASMPSLAAICGRVSGPAAARSSTIRCS